MKKSPLKKFLLFTLINIIVIGGVIILLSERPAIVSINNLELRNKKGDSLEVVMDLTVHNPNFYSISGHDVVIKSISGESVLGLGTIREFYLRGHSDDTISVVLSIGSDALLKAYTASKDQFQNTLEVTGSFWPLFFVSEMNVQPTLGGKEMNQLLLESFFADNVISFDSLSYSPVSAVESQMDFNVHMKNSFGFNFTVQELEVDVLPMQGSQTLIGNWKLTREITMKPGEPIMLPGSLSVHHMALMLAALEKGGQNLNTAWIDGSVTVLVDGTPLKIPFGFEVNSDMSKLNMGKSGQ